MGYLDARALCLVVVCMQPGQREILFGCLVHRRSFPFLRPLRSVSSMHGASQAPEKRRKSAYPVNQAGGRYFASHEPGSFASAGNQSQENCIRRAWLRQNQGTNRALSFRHKLTCSGSWSGGEVVSGWLDRLQVLSLGGPQTEPNLSRQTCN